MSDVVKPETIIAEHADFIDKQSGQRCCTCGMWESDGDARHSRASFAAHVVSRLAAHGHTIVPTFDARVEWGARLEHPQWIEVSLCDSYEDAVRSAASNKEWASTEPREVVQRTVVRTEWIAAAVSATQEER